VGATTTLGVTGEEGTGGSVPTRGGGRRLAFNFGTRDGRSKVVLTAVAGTGGREKVCLWAGADGGGKRAVGREGGCMSTLQGEVWRELGSPEDMEDVSSSVGSALEQLVSVKPPPTPRSSASSSSSTKSSLKTLPVVTTLVMEPVRLRLLP